MPYAVQRPVWLSLYTALCAAPASTPGGAPFKLVIECQWQPANPHTYSSHVTSVGVPGVCVKGAKRALGETWSKTPKAGLGWRILYRRAMAKIVGWLKGVPAGGIGRIGRVHYAYIDYSPRPGARIDVNNWAGHSLTVPDCPPNGTRCSRH